MNSKQAEYELGLKSVEPMQRRYQECRNSYEVRVLYSELLTSLGSASPRWPMLNLLAHIALGLHEVAEAHTFIEEYLQSFELGPAGAAMLTELEALKGNFDLAHQYLEHFERLHADPQELLFLKARVGELGGDLHSALSHFKDANFNELDDYLQKYSITLLERSGDYIKACSLIQSHGLDRDFKLYHEVLCSIALEQNGTFNLKEALSSAQENPDLVPLLAKHLLRKGRKADRPSAVGLLAQGTAIVQSRLLKFPRDLDLKLTLLYIRNLISQSEIDVKTDSEAASTNESITSELIERRYLHRSEFSHHPLLH